jgi:hypothetical protein
MVGADHRRGGTISKRKLWILYISIEMPMETIFLFLYIENLIVVMENAWVIKMLDILICCRE